MDEELKNASEEYCPDDAYPFGPDIINKEVRKAFIAGWKAKEKSEKPINQDELEEEIDRFEDWMETYNQADYPTSFTTRDIARHFAQWGAEHLNK